jgi:hypothetical protein
MRKKITKEPKQDWMKVERYLDVIIENNEASYELRWLDDLIVSSSTQTTDAIVNYYGDIMMKMSTLMVQCLSQERYELCAKIKLIIVQETQDIRYKIQIIFKEDEDTKSELIQFVNDINNITNKEITSLTKLLMDDNK